MNLIKFILFYSASLHLNSGIQKALLICAQKTGDKLPDPDMHIFSGKGCGKQLLFLN